MQKKAVLLAVILCFTQIFCGCGTNTSHADIVLRMHVRADSDSAAAQSVKLKTVAAIESYLSPKLKECDDAVALVRRELDTVTAIALSTLKSLGCGYGASASVERTYFPPRVYGDETIAGGEYDALIVRLGSGNGKNWWTVIYPEDTDDFTYGSIFFKYRTTD